MNSEAAASFDSVAELYDRARPGYPSSLYQDVMSLLGLSEDASVLDVGCGTGKSTQVFARGRHSIVALDPGAALLKICRQNLRSFPRVSFVESSFENWSCAERKFDLLISGTAFHWIDDPDLKHTLSLLNPDGGIAVFWHTYLNGSGPIRERLDQIYHDYAPALFVDDLSAAQEKDDSDKELRFAGCANLRDVRSMRYYSVLKYTAKTYTDLLRTFSTHRDLPELFYAEIAAAVDRVGGSIMKPLRTTCVVAGKR